jgi:hypothetical protein
MSTSDVVRFLIAALGGAAVGLERQWSGHADGPSARFAGIRTFTMLGAVGGLSGWLWTTGITVPGAILFAGAVAIVAAAYLAASRQDVDGTTEVAALGARARLRRRGRQRHALPTGDRGDRYSQSIRFTTLVPYLAAPALVAAGVAAVAGAGRSSEPPHRTKCR